MDELNQKLCQLMAEACTYPASSLERRQKLSEVHLLVMKSGKLWREYQPYYNDALQQMWEYCLQHPQEYDPTRGSVTSWLNYNLKKQLRRLRDAQYRQKQRQITVTITEYWQTIDPVENLPASPDIEPILEIWENTRTWVETDPKGILKNTLFRKRSDINAQVLLLRRLPPDTPWKNIAAEFQLTPAEAKDLPKFYNRKCLPLLRKFGRSQGYI
ncbi:MAG: sigma-70 family RNA polymerase sigma factor [Symploca sp. SIO1B1]|nr:sigma-70 family RNA polymerase sigma factor [Symploca sp. SIO1B1]